MRKLASISSVCEVNPRIPKGLRKQLNLTVTFLRMAAVQESGTISGVEEHQLGEVLKGYTYFEEGDVLVAKITPCMENGKAAQAIGLQHKIGFGSTEFHVLRPGDEIDGRYLFHMVWNPIFRDAAKRRMTGSAGQKRVPTSFFEQFKIPLPRLPEQRRIAAILDKANAIRRKRQQTLDLADRFLRSAFLDMFGDPVTNPKGWPVKKLGELGTFVSGGTPDKSNDVFWDGFFPWVSPKDMKRLYLTDAQDHVAKLAFTETPLRRIPSGSILIVVRGMILAHTVPMGLTRVPVAINQDIKGLVPNLEIDPTFLLFSLLTQHGHILSKVGTAAHGTRRLEMRDVEALPIPLPPADRQSHFDSLATIADRARETLLSRAGAADKLFRALVQRVFQGEL